MSRDGDAEWPLKSNWGAVQVNFADCHSHVDITDTYSHRQDTSPSHSVGETIIEKSRSYSLQHNITPTSSEDETIVEKSYFEEEVVVKRTICGASPKTFWTLLAVSLTLVVAGTIGGVVAAVVINKNGDSTR